jgi:hypothetical protein
VVRRSTLRRLEKAHREKRRMRALAEEFMDSMRAVRTLAETGHDPSGRHRLMRDGEEITGEPVEDLSE